MTALIDIGDGILGTDHRINESDVNAVLDYIGSVVPQDLSPHWTPGWPTEIEAALLDSVFSSRATYGGPENGVRRVVARWREYRSDEPLDDITRLAAFVDRPEALEEILGNRQRVGGNATSKAEAVCIAAAVFMELGISTAAQARDTIEADPSVRVQFEAVPGLGRISWECFLMQLGVRSESALEYLVQFVVDAILSQNPLSTESAYILLRGAAAHLSVPPDALEHAIWRFQHGRRSITRATT